MELRESDHGVHNKPREGRPGNEETGDELEQGRGHEPRFEVLSSLNVHRIPLGSCFALFAEQCDVSPAIGARLCLGR